jgi:hypothetical protein
VVVGAELVEDVADVLLVGGQHHHQLLGDRLVGLPAASNSSTSSSRSVSGSTSPGSAARPRRTCGLLGAKSWWKALASWPR